MEGYGGRWRSRTPTVTSTTGFKPVRPPLSGIFQKRKNPAEAGFFFCPGVTSVLFRARFTLIALFQAEILQLRKIVLT